jgi:predicted ATP-grasp superfamily ATP-dependent carboligase
VRPASAACVIGEVDLVRALGLAGIRSAVVAQPGNPARYSRHVLTCLPWHDPCSDGGALVASLRSFAQSQKEDPVLFYDGDWDVLAISRSRASLAAAGLRFVVPNAGLVEALSDKLAFQSLAEGLGLPVPRAHVLDPGSDEEVPLSFPIIAKPLTRLHATWQPLSRAKAVRVDTPFELRDLLERAATADVSVLLQELVEGPESAIESYHAYIDHDNEVAAEFTGKKHRTYPRAFGYSTLLETTDRGDVRAAGRETLGALGLTGVAKVDFKRRADGSLALLEINPRFNLWHHLGAVAGVNIPELVYRDLVGLPRPRLRAVRAGATWCSPRHDRLAARAEGISHVRWARDMARCDAVSGWALDDPMPLLRAALWRSGGTFRAARHSSEGGAATSGATV